LPGGQPCPAASELRQGTVGQFFFAGIEAAECGFHFVLQDRGRFAATLGLETTPREIVASCSVNVSTETNLRRSDMSTLGDGSIITLQMAQTLQGRNTWTS
jgi:hypothetical protein